MKLGFELSSILNSLSLALTTIQGATVKPPSLNGILPYYYLVILYNFFKIINCNSCFVLSTGIGTNILMGPLYCALSSTYSWWFWSRVRSDGRAIQRSIHIGYHLESNTDPLEIARMHKSFISNVLERMEQSEILTEQHFSATTMSVLNCHIKLEVWSWCFRSSKGHHFSYERQ